MAYQMGGAEGVMDARIGTLFSQKMPNRTGVITASLGFLFCMLWNVSFSWLLFVII